MSIGSVPVALDVLGVAVAQGGSTSERVLLAFAQILGLSLVAAVVAALVAAVYRWYVRERVPGGLPALFGLSAIVPYLGVNKLLRNAIEPVVGQTVVTEATAVFNIAAVLVALGATRIGADAGDHVGQELSATSGDRSVESEVGRVVQAVGRVITVELPEEIEDIVGYDPVPDATKEALADTTFVFPRRLTVDQLHDRLVTRLKADYAVGHVDLELAADGTVEYLAIGARAAGIGPTLPPETSAVAVRADPAFAASAGDLVQVWRTDPFQRVLTAEVRGSVDDVVTLAIDAADTRKLDAQTRYKLVTLPVEARPDREFASVLRAADETMAALTVASGSALAGQPVGALDVTVVAVRPREGAVEPLPARDRLLGPGDALYLVATPEAIRKVELGASPVDGHARPAEDGPSAGSGARLGPDEQVDASTPVSGPADDRPDTGTAAVETEQPDTPPSGAVTAEPSESIGSQQPPESAESTGPAAPSESSTADASSKSSTTDAPSESSMADASSKSSTNEAPSESSMADTPSESSTTDASSESSTTDASSESSTTDTPSESSESSGPSVLPLDEFAETPGIDALEPDESETADESTQAELSTEETPGTETLESDDADEEWAEPTRADLESLPGTDVNDLTGVRDASGEEETGEDDTAEEESDAETQTDDGDGTGPEGEDVDTDAGDEDDDIWVGTAERDEDPVEPATDDTSDDEDAAAGGDESDASPEASTDESGWSVAVDERRDSDEDE